MCLPYITIKIVQISNVCCALHNICKHFNIPIEDVDEWAATLSVEIDELKVNNVKIILKF